MMGIRTTGTDAVADARWRRGLSAGTPCLPSVASAAIWCWTKGRSAKTEPDRTTTAATPTAGWSLTTSAQVCPPLATSSPTVATGLFTTNKAVTMGMKTVGMGAATAKWTQAGSVSIRKGHQAAPASASQMGLWRGRRAATMGTSATSVRWRKGGPALLQRSWLPFVRKMRDAGTDDWTLRTWRSVTTGTWPWETGVTKPAGFRSTTDAGP
jgi:hypothetical protein